MHFLTLGTLFLSFISVYHKVEAIGKCGFPGKPVNGNIVPELALYSENQTVTFQCTASSLMTVHSSTNGTLKCTQNGTWTGPPPICAPFVTLKKKSQSYPESHLLLLNNLLDDTLSTCLELRPSGFRRWISIDLGERFGVRLVKLYSKDGSRLNVSVSVRDTVTNETTKCGSYEGNYQAGRSIPIDCRTLGDVPGFPGGIPGNKIIVEELSISNLPLVFCDIDGFGYNENTNCGLPGAPAFGSADLTGDTRAEVKCQKGFTLVGPKDQYCSSKGYWKYTSIGTTPSCRIENWQANFSAGKTCTALENWITNAAIFYQLDRSVAIVECKEGYELAAGKVLLCTAFGVWLGYAGLDEHCKKKVNCGEPPVLENYVLQHVEGFSGSSQAMYFCDNSAKVFGISKCLDNGTWSGLLTNLLCDSPTREPPTMPTTYLSSEAINPTIEANATETINTTFEASATEAVDFENTCGFFTKPVFISLAAWAGLSSIILVISCCYQRKRHENEGVMQFSHLQKKFGNEGNSTTIKSRESKQELPESDFFQNLPLCDLEDGL